MTNTPSIERLKPCPFCGGEPQIERSFSGGPYVLCDHCGAATMFAKRKAKAIELWNTRATLVDVDQYRHDLIARYRLSVVTHFDPPCDSDQSGEAIETTKIGSTGGESAGLKGIAQVPDRSALNPTPEGSGNG